MAKEKFFKLKSLLSEIAKLKTPIDRTNGILSKKISELALELSVLADNMGEELESSTHVSGANSASAAFEACSGAGERAPSITTEEELSTLNMMTIHYMYGISLCKSLDCVSHSESKSIELVNILEAKIAKIHSRIIEIISPILGGKSVESDDSTFFTESVSCRTQIDKLRKDTSSKLSEITALMNNPTKSKEFIDESQILLGSITEGMKSYLVTLVSQASKILGTPPVKYTIVGLGSMAMKQITPYSDLEFAILTEDNSYKSSDNPKISNYFRNLSHYVHFKVICLGETVIPKSLYDIHGLDSLVRCAVNFDLGGKTPLGRADKDYDLICTPAKMAEYLRGNYKVASLERRDSKLEHILENTCFITGTDDKGELTQDTSQGAALLTDYQDIVRGFLADGARRPEIEDASYAASAAASSAAPSRTISYSELRAVKILQNNLETFEFKSFESPGKLFDVKQEIYRIPDRFIFSLGSIFNIISKLLPEKLLSGISVLEIIDQLHKQEILSEEDAMHLKNSACYANTLRLRTYDFYKQQQDAMDIIPDEEETITVGISATSATSESIVKFSERFKLTEAELCDDGALFKFYYTALPLMKLMAGLCDNLTNTSQKDQRQEICSGITLFVNTAKIKGDIFTRLSNYKKALEYQPIALKESEAYMEYVENLNNIAKSLHASGKYQEALENYKEALHILKEKHAESHYNLKGIYGSIGEIYRELGDYDKALEYYNKVLSILRKNFDESHRDISACNNNIGLVYTSLGRLEQKSEEMEKSKERYKEALEHYETALSILRKNFDESHPDIPQCYDNIGTSYGDLGDHKKALEYRLKAFLIFQDKFGEQHERIAICYNNIASSYGDLGDHKKALEYQLKALDILLKKFSSELHPHVASSYDNIGGIYRDLGDYKKALEYKLKALDIRKFIFPESHPDITTSLHNISHTYIDLSRELQKILEDIRDKPCKSLSLAKAKSAIEKLLEVKTTLYGLDSKEALSFREKISEFFEKLPHRLKETPVAKDIFSILKSGLLQQDIENFEDIPAKDTSNPDLLRVVSYNIAVDFFDDKDKTGDHRHHWEVRKPYVIEVLRTTTPDVMCLQELSPDQALELSKTFKRSFSSIFLSQTPSDIPAGVIARGGGVEEWVAKHIGTPLIGIFFKKKTFQIKKDEERHDEIGRFWLNETPDEVPNETDRGCIDKGFGNMNTYRATFWVALEYKTTGKQVYVFNNHYPLSGDSDTRKKCAELERDMIKKISGDHPWISLGDRNMIDHPSDEAGSKSPLTIYRALTTTRIEGDKVYDVRDAKKHFGVSGTFLGFSYDEHRMALSHHGEKNNILDLIISNRESLLSFSHPAGFRPKEDSASSSGAAAASSSPDPKEGLISLSEYNPEIIRFLDEERYYASDHVLLGGDFDIS